MVTEIRPEDREQLARFEDMGEAAVKLHVNTGGFSHPVHRLAIKWLAQREEEERVRNEASLVSQMRTALSAKKASWVAAIASIIAAIISMIGTAITFLSWIFPPHQP